MAFTGLPLIEPLHSAQSKLPSNSMNTLTSFTGSPLIESLIDCPAAIWNGADGVGSVVGEVLGAADGAALGDFVGNSVG